MTTDDQYDSLFLMFGDRYVVPWRLLKAQARAESALDPRAQSPAGAQGISQFMPATFKEWSGKCDIKDADVWNPQHAIQCQAAYMSALIDMFSAPRQAQGVVSQSNHAGEKALAAYNWGMGNLRRCIEDHGDAWRDHLPDETKSYIEKILREFAETWK